MPDIQCVNCTEQKELGCRAYRWRDKTPPGEDPRNDWINPAVLPITIDGEDIYACPRQSLYEDPKWWDQLLLFYGLFSKGFLPDRGGVLDQCNAAMDLFRIVDGVSSECDRSEIAEKQRPKGDPFVGRGHGS